MSAPPPAPPVSALPRNGRRSHFAQREVHPSELPGIMRKHIYTGAMGSVYGYLISGVFFTFYGQAIGLSVMGWGGLLGVSSFFLGFQVLSAFLTQRLGQRKIVWFSCAMASRVLRLVSVVVSYLLWRQGSTHVAWALMGLVWLSILFGTMAEPPWLSWLADLVPERHHGGFWGRRSQWITLIALGAVFPAAWLVDSVSGPRQVTAMAGVFCVAALIGIVDLLIHNTIPEPAMACRRHPDLLQHLLAPLKDRGFRPWLVFIMCWNFGMTFGGSLNFFHFLDDLGFKNHLVPTVLVLMAIPMLGSLCVARWSGRMVDRVGPKRVLKWGHFFWALLPLIWLFARPDTTMAYVWIGLAGLVAGTSSTVGMIAANKLVTRYPPAEDRAMYVAVSACLASLAGGFGPILEGLMISAVGHAWTWTVGGVTFVAFHIAYVTSFVLRMVSARILIPRVTDLQSNGNGNPRI